MKLYKKTSWTTNLKLQQKRIWKTRIQTYKNWMPLGSGFGAVHSALKEWIHEREKEKEDQQPHEPQHACGAFPSNTTCTTTNKLNRWRQPKCLFCCKKKECFLVENPNSNWILCLVCLVIWCRFLLLFLMIVWFVLFFFVARSTSGEISPERSQQQHFLDSAMALTN